MAYVVHMLRLLVWVLGSLRRRLGRAPDYVTFVAEGPYPQLPAPRPPFPQRLLQKKETSLQDLREQFRRVAGDRRVKGVVLHLRPLRMPPAHVETLRDLIGELRAAGKRVVAWATNYSMSSYFAASAADEILLQPGGHITPLGLRQHFVFFADALRRVGIKADFIQISPYKSAADPLMRTEMSEEVREMANWLIDSVYGEIVAGIAGGRGVEVEKARTLIDEAPYTDLRAEEAGVVDGLVWEEDLPAHLGAGRRPARVVPWERARRRVLRSPPPSPGRYVALVRIEGSIVDGRSGRPPLRPPFFAPFLLEPRAGDLSVVHEIRKAAAAKRAAAVVLYVDSGGGSDTSSEAMAAALRKAAARKPLVVSMGAVAGSGGYWVSTPGRWIVAQPSTITGSIGVLWGKLVTSGLMEKLLFRRETISRGRNVTMGDTSHPYSDEERKKVWDDINRIYELFLERVSESRRMAPEAVNAVGVGRVWTGRQALERGLVDELGGLEKAIAKARALAGLGPRAPVREVRPEKRPQPPVPQPAAALEYLLEGVRMFNESPALCLCPLTFEP